jgi:hypothetical protein
MSTQRYSVTPHPIETLLTWVKSGEIAMAAQCKGGKKKYGGITDRTQMRESLQMSCVPESMLDGVVPAYDDFLEERRKLMALKIKAWFETL